MVDVVLFPTAAADKKGAGRTSDLNPNNNMITVGGKESKSAFQKAYESS